VITPEAMQITRMSELTRLAWKVGIVYFQVYVDKPDPEFYKALNSCEAYERVVEIQTPHPDMFRSQVHFRGACPFFGAVTGGWFRGCTDNPNDTVRIIQAARKGKVLPHTNPRRPESPDEYIKLEGV
jgi:hypothetical protein